MSQAFLPGAKVFFPNITLKLVRSNLPPHQAVFHCPPTLNKFDIRQLLEKMYDLQITDIRTMNYLGKPSQMRNGRKIKGQPKYKKAIVSMQEDFVWPAIPTVKDNDATRMPPMVTFGKGSANKHRKEIERQALERGVEVKKKQT
ncbi:ribosomal protein L23/L15e core domain-containing protein [Gorgonomyces haynaldii]|nr:ribosomal protein L23/L15e core domain-containing protein [Gorgonomyces haynaldii]